ncbi:MAG: 50S ribosomal protein L17 [Candidatus Woesebacteria bacterium GW2011_GWA1_39_21b]|uniref:Large ribosomal subunit protein bL17 n=3 Tax=Patescibacteria group TaxID=1783273 RepID=A0A1G2QFE8_9BACT|nr:MAG: 50S ribosomal protein L17 [Candidatus Woesebacteria bacterium GW2011_GWA1_39_21b]KKS77202.1 MAG: 50S ribosomal protein L17 [Parcubacteria group bacterium GW2011_GWB1_42_9]KKS89775.1 MAG: 50S ribosomal protein L17 [Parcubacteria group bacterium GW2011_GWC1_43_11b]OHA59345.1 MAG: 50S ribosomal protein L17 [Candidatus Vogelbacteria bacterium RIFOXYB1_FULL_42_16]OHA60270.1 MAG: 50S ribosomal protein L17 [Candidatus Vogelbacteria bacterium RIFOXYD1_FULL_42_15]
MQHHKTNRKLGRKTGQRQALLRTLAGSLILRGRIKTTEAKAKELRPFIEKIVTKAKTDSVAKRRLVVEVLGGGQRIEKLFKEIGPRFSARAGGYTRIIKLPIRQGDASKMAVIEFV